MADRDVNPVERERRAEPEPAHASVRVSVVPALPLEVCSACAAELAQQPDGIPWKHGDPIEAGGACANCGAELAAQRTGDGR